ncbi:MULTISPECIES: hypothetical protein [unclassified Endozoicomonas]|uniref:hypothetical protein n=1 Tax=unclassified Endozoicomonas TaxID=2644528 RepID=UPI0021472A23|nr:MULTISPECIES: hypothetical protein [unclassified Endozoicomonas]
MYSCMTPHSPVNTTSNALQLALNAFSEGKEQAKTWLYNGASRAVSTLYWGASEVSSMARNYIADMHELNENDLLFEWDWDETDIGDRQVAVTDAAVSVKEQSVKEQLMRAPSRIPRPVARPEKKPGHAFMAALSRPHPIPFNTPGAEVADRYQKNIRTVVFGDKDERRPKIKQKALSSDFLARQKALSDAKQKYEDDLKAPVTRDKCGKVNPETTRRLAQPKHTRSKGEKKAIRDFTQREFASHAFTKLYLRQDFEKDRPVKSQSRQNAKANRLK